MGDDSTQLDGKIAIVTGAAQGMGAGIARRVAAAGATVIIADIKNDEGEKSAQEIRTSGGEAEFVRTDVAEDAEVENLIGHAVKSPGKLDIVINNAAIVHIGLAEETSIEEWDRLMAVNVRSMFLTTRYAVPQMRKQGGGCFVNIGSISSFVAQRGTPAYTASKGAVLLLTKSYAVDYALENIRFNCLCPGITDTPLLRQHTKEADLANRLTRVPVGKIVTPDEVGNAAVFLCSDAANAITGTSLLVDKGYISCAEFEP